MRCRSYLEGIPNGAAAVALDSGRGTVEVHTASPKTQTLIVTGGRLSDTHADGRVPGRREGTRMWGRIVIRWIMDAIAVAAAVAILHWINPAWVTLNSNSAWIGVIVMAAVLGFVNAIIKPILSFLSCGCLIATLGLFMLIINAFVLWLSGEISGWFNTGFSINGFWPAFWGAIIISVVSFLLAVLLPEPEYT